ncbi:RIP metalloprotease RseP [Yoonia sp. BS5-3]|uniref:Zinc metalloprotease n=1 Tax=Yoonia phaeophyticola TaxID=3137369 RepID=A0ABZ2UZM5_9RHOB
MDLTSFVPLFGNFAFTLGAFILALSIIVAIHEYGHYIVGRWCGIHAEVFSLGFGPVIWSGTDARGTQWQIAALPLGGYVKFLGDANAASVGSDGTVPEVDARRTMLGAPLWARTLTVLAGPVFNFILAMAVFAGTIMYQGRVSEPLTLGSFTPLPPSFAAELQEGDVLLAIEGVPVDDPDRQIGLVDALPLQERLAYSVLRDGEEITVDGPYLMPSAVASVVPRSAADDADLKIDDVIMAVDGEPIFAFTQLQEIVPARAGDALELLIWRDGEELTVTLEPRATDEPQPDGTFRTVYRIGISGQMFFEPQTDSVSLFEAVPMAVDGLWNTLTTSISAIKHIIIGRISTCNLSGPVGMAQTVGSMAEQGWDDFILSIGLVSAAVGLVNLFPVPVLDGGHLAFYAYEAVTRRKPNDRVLQVFMLIGLTLILMLMTFTVLNDTLLCP